MCFICVKSLEKRKKNHTILHRTKITSSVFVVYNILAVLYEKLNFENDHTNPYNTAGRK